jgi:hypothetical protein
VAPCFEEKLFLQPVVLTTKREGSMSKKAGGVGTYVKIRADICKLLRDSSARAVTTFLDYYGLPKDFPGKATLPKSGDIYTKVAHLEKEFEEDIQSHCGGSSHTGRFIPFIMVHEFEALLFAEPTSIGSHFGRESSKHLLRLPQPEYINDTQERHPKARIIQIAHEAGRGYKPTIDGMSIAQAIGLARMRDACPHFNAWLQRLEQL